MLAFLLCSFVCLVLPYHEADCMGWCDGPLHESVPDTRCVAAALLPAAPADSNSNMISRFEINATEAALKWNWFSDCVFSATDVKLLAGDLQLIYRSVLDTATICPKLFWVFTLASCSTCSVLKKGNSTPIHFYAKYLYQYLNTSTDIVMQVDSIKFVHSVEWSFGGDP